MAGTSRPRNLEEWQHWVERTIAEGRRGPISLVTTLSTQVQDQGQTIVRVPAAPVEITYQTAMYMALTARWERDFQYRAVRVIVDFSDVTKATDGTDIDVERYELWARNETPGVLARTTSAVPGKAYPGMTAPSLVKTFEAVEAEAEATPTWVMVATSTDSSFRANDFVPGSTWRFRIRAIGEGTIQPGRWSSEFVITMQEDNDPPAQPTAPRVTSKRGQLIVTYDGQSVSGAMPADLSYVILAQGSESSPTTEVHRFGRDGGEYVATGVTYFDTQFFRLQAVDEAGNRSAWSEQSFGYPEPLVDTDIILSELDAAKTHLKNVDAGVSILPDTIITEHLRVTEDMSAALGKFLYLKAGQIDTNSLWADQAFFGLADALLVRSDMFVGKAFEGGTFTLKQGGKYQTDPEDLKGIKITSAGIQAWDSFGTMTYDLSAATGNMVATGTFYTDLTGSRARLGDRENITALDLWADDTLNHTALYHEFAESQHRTMLANFTTTIDRDSYLLLNGSNTLLFTNWGFFESVPGLTRIAHHSVDGDPYTALVANGGTTPFAQMILKTGSRFEIFDNRFTARLTSNAGPYLQATNTFGFTLSLGNFSGPERTEHAILSRDQFWVQLAKGNEFLMTAGNWQLGSAVTVDTGTGAFGRGRIIGAQDNVQIYSTGSGGGAYPWFWLRHDQPAQLTGGMNVFGNFNVFNGTKNFVMSHPLKPGRELVHAATESPWSGIEYWGDAKLNAAGFWIVELPEYFEAIAAQDQRLVKAFAFDGTRLSWTKIMDGQFMVEGEPGTEFGWEVKARREGYEFEVEPFVGRFRDAGESQPEPENRLSGRTDKPVESRDDGTKESGNDNGRVRADTSGRAEGHRNSGAETGFGDYLERNARGGA